MDSPVMLAIAFSCYLLAGLLAVVARLAQKASAGRLSLAGSALGLILQATFIVGRTASGGVLPFASRFESMALLGFAVQLSGLAVRLAWREDTVKAITDVLSAGLLSAAVFGPGFHAAGNLNPILHSPYFSVHILTAFAGYGVLVAGTAWAIGQLVDARVGAHRHAAKTLAGIAVLTLGAGILLGAFWADVSWGSYWNWDPKESWALFTWAVLAAYLHVRDRQRRWLDLAGFGLAFLLMLFTFIGINMLRWGMHRY
jgi:ABC-type transport system involved in cytochrome c biogenesis permease subunit